MSHWKIEQRLGRGQQEKLQKERGKNGNLFL
jgi:hypothetical protein